MLPRNSTGSRDLAHPDLALAVVVTGVVIAAVDATIVVLALPEIQRALKVDVASVIWVIIGYLLVMTVLSMQVGRLGDMFGRVRMYEAGFLVFIVGSFLCALAFNEASLIAFRVLQGAGGALISANSGAVIADIFPPEKRGRAYGFTAVGWSVGAVLGIVIGGVIVTYIDWRWIFWINVPIGLVALVAATRILREKVEQTHKSIDWAGMILLGTGLFGVLWGMTELAREPFNATIGTFIGAGVVILAAFAVAETKVRDPMIHFSLLRVPTMSASLFASLVQAMANFSVLFLLIMYLQGVKHLSPLHASLLLVPGYVIGSFMGPLAGKTADRRSPVLPATLGLAAEAVALVIYASLGVGSSLWIVIAASIINGLGGAAFFPANNSAVMKASPPAMFGISSGMLRTFSNVGMVFSFTISIVIAALSIPRRAAFAIFVGTTHLKKQVAALFTTGLHSAFYASAGLMLLAALLSATRVLSRDRPAFGGPQTGTGGSDSDMVAGSGARGSARSAIGEPGPDIDNAPAVPAGPGAGI